MAEFWCENCHRKPALNSTLATECPEFCSDCAMKAFDNKYGVEEEDEEEEE